HSVTSPIGRNLQSAIRQMAVLSFFAKSVRFCHIDRQFAPIYNKAPRHTCEQAYAMLYALYAELLKHTAAENVIFLGDSAGGGLALAFAQDLLKTDLPQPKQLILLSPWVDISMSNDEMDALDKLDPNISRRGLLTVAKAWAGDTDLHEPKLSPLFGSNKGIAKTALFVGTREMLLPDCRLYREKALAEGVELTYIEEEGVNHCYPFYPTPEAKKAKKQIINLINTGRI
ncbi:MAG: alpha/beta hydrolase, partial [Clostridia bacterium]|nr:alpha/beta hydrolase [Clostridia bacterium]